MKYFLAISILLFLCTNSLSYPSSSSSSSLKKKLIDKRNRCYDIKKSSIALSSTEALDLLHYGHQTQLSNNMTWFIMIISGYLIQYKIFRIFASN